MFSDIVETYDVLIIFLLFFVAVVRALAMMALGYIVKDSELTLLQLDVGVFHFLVHKAEMALASVRGISGWHLDEVLHALATFSRLDSNRGMMSTDGMFDMILLFLKLKKKMMIVVMMMIDNDDDEDDADADD